MTGGTKQLVRVGRAEPLLVTLGRRPRHELEFLPAALEIIDTPAPPAARLIPATICGFCVVALAWSIVGRIDIVANAPGTVIPSGKVKVVQSRVTAIVQRILVVDGDHVLAGQPVIQLDATTAAADRDRIGADLAQSKVDVAGLTALRNNLTPPDAPLSPTMPLGVAKAQFLGEVATITARQAEQRAKLASLVEQMSEKRVEAEENATAIDKLRAELPMLAGVRDMYRNLDAKRLASRIDVLGAEQKFSDAAHDLATQIEHGGEARANLAALTQQYKEQQANYAHAVEQDLGDSERKLSENNAQYLAAVHEAEQMVLRAPVTGIVQQVSIHSEHGVVTPAERLLVMVPDAQPLVVEAMIANRDIGFVRAGQAVSVKVATYSFTRYGLIPGQVVNVSRDAVDDTPNDAQNPNGASKSGDTRRLAGSESDLDGGEGTGYIAQIALSRQTITVDHHIARLKPGMSVTAEIFTGNRRIISYLLSPMLRYVHDAGGER